MSRCSSSRTNVPDEPDDRLGSGVASAFERAEPLSRSDASNVAFARYVPGSLTDSVARNEPSADIVARVASTGCPDRSRVTTTCWPSRAGPTTPRTSTRSNSRTGPIRTASTARTETVTGSLVAPARTATYVVVADGWISTENAPAPPIVVDTTSVLVWSRIWTAEPAGAPVDVPESVTLCPNSRSRSDASSVTVVVLVCASARAGTSKTRASATRSARRPLTAPPPSSRRRTCAAPGCARAGTAPA